VRRQKKYIGRFLMATTEQLFDRTGTKLDFSDPQVRIDLWKTLKDHRFSD
jgi:hypothetical protein